jgi:hypothetical protein
VSDHQKDKKREGRDAQGRFVKGYKGGGRPAIAQEFRDKCRDYMSEKGWNNIVDMAEDPESPHRYKANELIAAYAYGKPKQGVEFSGEDGGPVQVVFAIPRPKDSE